jgi:transcriptional regulator with XRE-family HTH domain
MDDYEKTFGDYLRQLIKESGMTQIEFYTALGIKKPYFYDIISGRTNPPPYSLQLKAMDVLNTTSEVRERFFDLAARGRKELPADIAQYVTDNPSVLKDLRNKMKLATNR